MTELNEPFSNNFVDDLIIQITECKKLLTDSLHAPQAQGNTQAPMDKHRALTTLDLSKNATAEQIRKAFRRLSLIHHPDKGGNPEVFKTILSAYEFLTPKS